VRKWALPVLLGLLLMVAFVLGSEVRERLGFSLSLEGLTELREWVEGLGWAGTAVFVGLVTFRGFLLLLLPLSFPGVRSWVLGTQEPPRIARTNP
jgi:uncharacterized membrane protein YdjX (TVP38/TMEM64 family)